MDPTILSPPMWWENATLWSAVAACISAFFAGLTVFFRIQKSTREMIDIVKADILVLTSAADGRKKWQNIFKTAQTLEGLGPHIRQLAGLLATKKVGMKRDKKYLSVKWVWIIPAAIEELHNEGYKWVKPD